MVKQLDKNPMSSIELNKRFSTLTRNERENYLVDHQLLTRDDLATLIRNAL